MEEIEVKFLDINPTQIKRKLIKLGAKKVFAKVYRRRVFDYPDRKLDREGAWLRLRDEGDSIKLTYKKRLGVKDMHGGKINDRGMEEIEVNVSGFDKTAKLFKRLGFIEKFYEENRRVRYLFNGVEIDIDYYPMIKPYLEIEANSWKDVDETINLLGLNPKDRKLITAQQVYALSGIDENDYSVITFEKQLKKHGK